MAPIHLFQRDIHIYEVTLELLDACSSTYKYLLEEVPSILHKACFHLHLEKKENKKQLYESKHKNDTQPLSRKDEVT